MFLCLKTSVDVHLVPFPNSLITGSFSTSDQAFPFTQVSESMGDVPLCACLIPASSVSKSSMHIASDNGEMETPTPGLREAFCAIFEIAFKDVFDVPCLALLIFKIIVF